MMRRPVHHHRTRLRRLSEQLQLDPTPVAETKKGGPMAGVKVLDFCQFGNGPSATGQLSDNGADVLKVEPPEGDGFRGTFAPGVPNMMFEARNRGKRSICVDLKNPNSKEVIKRLVAWADVVTDG